MLSYFYRTPLAWLNLIHDPRRLLTSLAGVTFAVLLMFSFTGFKHALYDSQIRLVHLLNADIIIINPLKDNAFVPRTFARNQLYQAQTVPGVEATYPFYIGVGSWRNPQTHETRGLRIFAFNPADPVLLLPQLPAKMTQLRLSNTVLMDDKSRKEIGVAPQGIVTELAERQVRVVGTFSLGTDFFAPNGNLIMSDQNLLRYTNRELSGVDLGLVKVSPQVNLNTIVVALRQKLPDVMVLTKEQLIQRELNYWRNNSNIGFVFDLLTITGFVVGIVLVYQILYTDVSDHWAEYATLKAMGYRNSYLLGVVLQEAIILSILGFVLGFAIGALLYRSAAQMTSLAFLITWHRSLFLFGLTFVMCFVAGAIAVRKVQQADPAEVFG